MMSIISIQEPWEKTITLYNKMWTFPYKVYDLIELEDSLIVCYSWSDVKANPPSKDFYFGCTVWCYNKTDQLIKWIIEEPPIVFGKDGKPATRGMSPYFPDINRDELYLGIFYNAYYGSILVDTTGARRFKLDHETGKVEFLYDGLR